MNSSASTKEIILRKDAERLGLKRYFTGKPCKRGHISEYFVKGSCCTCALIRIQEKRKDPEFRKTEVKRELEKRKINPEYKAKRSETSRRCHAKKRKDPNFVLLSKKKNKEWYAKPESKKWVAEYNKRRIAENPTIAIAERVRGRIKDAFRRMGYTKKSKTSEIIGCSFDELKSHIERQFMRGMNWENRNKWHIDHIIPLSSAKNEDDVIKLSHFTNLRPLWAKENQRKNAKILHLL